MNNSFDVAITGAGIIGLATAMTLLEEFPGLKVAVLEKETMIASHQTGHNSGVIHSGLYYRPGSLKSVCVSRAAMNSFGSAGSTMSSTRSAERWS